jgi:hypothetical protein
MPHTLSCLLQGRKCNAKRDQPDIYTCTAPTMDLINQGGYVGDEKI